MSGSGGSPATVTDVFLSYATEDKDSVARPLVAALQDRAISVWFDEAAISVGDSVAAVIARGIASARMSVVILSPAFFRKHWTKRELDALLSRELSEGSQLILPVWHKIDVPDLIHLSPILAARVGISTAEGIPRVADRIAEALEHSLDLLRTGQLPVAFGLDGRPLAADDSARRALDLSVNEFNDRVIAHLAENPHLLYELPPRRFEELVAEIYARAEYEVELTPASGDGGVDVYAVRRDDLGSTLIVVQAKRYKPELKVEASAVRELLGTVDLAQASAGVLVTTSTFRPGAERLAQQHQWRLALRDYARLQSMLKHGRPKPP